MSSAPSVCFSTDSSDFTLTKSPTRSVDVTNLQVTRMSGPWLRCGGCVFEPHPSDDKLTFSPPSQAAFNRIPILEK